MIHPKILSLLGFAIRAKALATGSFNVEEGIKNRKVHLVIMAEDASKKRQEHLRSWCKEQDIPFYIMGTMEDFGSLLKTKPIGLIAVKDKSLSSGMIQYIDQAEVE